MEMLQQFILQITTLRGPMAVVVFIIFVGYMLKMTPRFPNRFIPLVSFLLGPLLTLIMVAWPTPGSMEPGIRWPDLAAWFTAIIQGFLLSCLAWISHAQVLRRFIDNKVPALNPGKTVDTSTQVQEHVEAGETVRREVEEKVTTDLPKT